MTAKQEYAICKVVGAIPDEQRDAFREIAEYAVSLGYMPILKGAKESYVDFTKGKIKRTILKIATDKKLPPWLAIKFYAMPEYTGIFREGVRDRVGLLEQMEISVRCWGCGKCDGTQGYTYELTEGRKGFLCGNGLIPLPAFGAGNVSEVKAAMRVQDEYFMTLFCE